MANRKHYAVTLGSNGSKTKTRLWDYYRLNRKNFSALAGKLDSEVRTIGIKNALKKKGWRIEEYPTEVLIIEDRN